MSAMLLRGTRTKSHWRYLSRAFSTRATGYVSFFHQTENFGFAVRDDDPSKEFHFTSSDLHCENLPKVRNLAKVEFSTVETGYGRRFARDVSGPLGKSLNFRHHNIRLPAEQRTLKLSDVSDEQRFTGVVTHITPDNSSGYIVPDKLQYESVLFDMKDLQTTGKKMIRLHSEVEFVAKARTGGKVDKAYRITRPGGGLITFETKDIGARRRILGEMYKPSDKLARLPPECQEYRKKGYIFDVVTDKSLCWICPEEDPFTRVFCSLDDIHISGNRTPKVYQPVEYSELIDQTKSWAKAIHVTGPSSTVIHTTTDNELLGDSRRTRKLDTNPDVVHTGFVASVIKPQGKAQEFFGFILPDEVGAAKIYFHRGGLQFSDFRRIEQGSKVQFNTRVTDDGNIQATNILAFGGMPLTATKGPIGDFFRGMGVLNSSLEAAPVTGERYQGFCSGFDIQSSTGWLEIVGEKRFKRVQYQISDVAGVPERVPMGCFLEFEIQAKQVGYDEEGRIATKITSVGLDTFDPSYMFKYSPVGLEN